MSLISCVIYTKKKSFLTGIGFKEGWASQYNILGEVMWLNADSQQPYLYDFLLF